MPLALAEPTSLVNFQRISYVCSSPDKQVPHHEDLGYSAILTPSSLPWPQLYLSSQKVIHSQISDKLPHCCSTRPLGRISAAPGGTVLRACALPFASSKAC